MTMMILGPNIPKKDETVYFNVDLTEPDEVYELTGYQESKIKVRPISRVQFLRGISVVNWSGSVKYISEGMCDFGIFSDSRHAVAFPSLVPKLQNQNDVPEMFTEQCWLLADQ